MPWPDAGSLLKIQGLLNLPGEKLPGQAQASSMAERSKSEALEVPIKIYQDKEIIDEAQPF